MDIIHNKYYLKQVPFRRAETVKVDDIHNKYHQKQQITFKIII